jgi:cysteine sulfinate desulfinase/cysteine desulfurase-like protein
MIQQTAVDEGDSKLTKSEFWMRLAGASFGLWALMIPVGVMMIGGVFERATKTNIEAASEIVAFNKRFEAYVLNMERRVTIIEERQNRVLQAIDSMNSDLHGQNPKPNYRLNGKNGQ